MQITADSEPAPLFTKFPIVAPAEKCQVDSFFFVDDVLFKILEAPKGINRADSDLCCITCTGKIS